MSRIRIWIVLPDFFNIDIYLFNLLVNLAFINDIIFIFNYPIFIRSIIINLILDFL